MIRFLLSKGLTEMCQLGLQSKMRGQGSCQLFLKSLLGLNLIIISSNHNKWDSHIYLVVNYKAK